MQYWIAVDQLPDQRGRPSAIIPGPSFIVVTFEMTILFGGIAAVFGMLALNGLPMPYHPVFNVPRFVMATQGPFLPDRVLDRSQVQPAGTAAIS